ncbi:MAG: type II toxin-antitoxin system HicA family toxin [Candidatus Goldbacteria bacterium]|nr:type II toxin-antitoxin system HicA family toxin [Candidatus Goldiibacteriota bacterium]
MDKLPVISGKDLIKLLNKLGFTVTRQKGSHARLKHHDGRVTTVPIHRGADLPKGLLRKIIREDIKLTLEEFIELTKKKQ